LCSLRSFAVARLKISTGTFHSGEGVEGHNERHIEAVFESMPYFAAQPVVGMHGVNSATGFNIVDNGLCEFIDDVGERFFRQVMWPGLHVDNPVPGLDNDFSGEVSCIGSGVDDALGSLLSERRCHFAHVNIHATTVTNPWLSKG
jgi:hypothetical protein